MSDGFRIFDFKPQRHEVFKEKLKIWMSGQNERDMQSTYDVTSRRLRVTIVVIATQRCLLCALLICMSLLTVQTYWVPHKNYFIAKCFADLNSWLAQVFIPISLYSCPILIRFGFPGYMFINVPNIKFHSNLFSGSGLETCGQTDKTRLIGIFSRIFELTQ